jgi:hypothetical protein
MNATVAAMSPTRAMAGNGVEGEAEPRLQATAAQALPDAAGTIGSMLAIRVTGADAAKAGPGAMQLMANAASVTRSKRQPNHTPKRLRLPRGATESRSQGRRSPLGA